MQSTIFDGSFWPDSDSFSHTASPDDAEWRHHTFDAFALAKSQLLAFESMALPSVVSAAVVALSIFDRPQVRIRNVDRAVCGLTLDGKSLHDFRISVNATLTDSRATTNDELRRSFGEARKIASTIDPKVANFFQLALGEQDSLKKFLYFFLSIEVSTHRTFKKIRHSEHLTSLNAPDARIQLASVSFFGDSKKSWTSLRDRFLWCAHCVWTDLIQSDVSEFARLKRIRDGIAHGDITTPSGGDVLAVEKLAIKLHQQNQAPKG